MRPKVFLQLSFVLLFFLTFFISITLTVSTLVKSGEEVQVPDLIGLQGSEAESLLGASGLRYGFLGYRHSSDFRKGTVLEQSHEPGFSLPIGRTVSVYYSKGPRTRVVPDIVGLPRSTAEEILRSSQMQSKVTAYTCATGIPEGNVLAQAPMPHEVTHDDGIELLLSSGNCEDRFILRDLRGSFLRNVLLEMSQEGLTLRTVQYLSSEGRSEGEILSHAPAAYSAIPRFQMIHFEVAGPSEAAFQELQGEGGKFVYLPIHVPFGFLPKKARIELIREESGLTYAHEFTAQPGEKRAFLFWKDSDTEVSLELNGLKEWQRGF